MHDCPLLIEQFERSDARKHVFGKLHVKMFVCLLLYRAIQTENFCHDNVNVKKCTNTKKITIHCPVQTNSIQTQQNTSLRFFQRNRYLHSIQTVKVIESTYFVII